MLILNVQLFKTLPIPNRFDIVLNPESGRFSSIGTATAVEGGKCTFLSTCSYRNATVVQVAETVELEGLGFLMSGKLVLFLFELFVRISENSICSSSDSLSS